MDWVTLLAFREIHKMYVTDDLIFLALFTQSLLQVLKFTHVRTELMGKDTIIIGKFV